MTALAATATATYATALTSLRLTSFDQSALTTRVTGFVLGDDLSSELLIAAATRLQNPGGLVDALDVLPELDA
jgi:hypothetical protein